MTDFKTLGEVFRTHQSFAIFSHANADGDTIGSALGLGVSLKKLGKKVIYIVPEPVPLKFSFLKDYEFFNKEREFLKKVEVGVLLDAAMTSRIEELEKELLHLKITIDIDHHSTSGEFATYNYIESSAPSTSAILLKLFESEHFPIDADISNAFFTGLMTDTGSFHYSNATKEAFEIGSKLVGYGARPDFIGTMFYEQETLSHLKILGIALMRMKAEGELAYSYLTLQDFVANNASEEDTEGIVDYMRKLSQVKIILFFKERSGDVKVSLRGKEGTNVKEIAERFGGGGHILASGCALKLPLEDSITTVLKAVYDATEKRREK
jgi:phosphoesterase RecJ-like protein